MNIIENLKEQVKELKRQKKNLRRMILYYKNWEHTKKLAIKQNNKRKEYRSNWSKSEKSKNGKREYKKKYITTDSYDKSNRISNWKIQGLIDNYDKVYEIFEYTLFCDECRCDLDQCSKSVKCMDHDHTTGLFRNILCKSCNSKRR